MNFVEDIIENIWVQRFFWSFITIIVSVIIYRLIAHFLNQHEKKKSKLLSNKKSRTYNRMVKSVIRYAIIILVSLIILQIFGVDVSSMLAAAGIASVIIAFAIQDALKDVIRGFDIVSDNYYNVGDVIKVGTFEGKVLAVGLKTTKIKDIVTGNLVSIANRNILEAEVMSGIIDIDIPFPYEVRLEKAEKTLAEIVEKLKEQETIKNAEYRKVSNFSESSMDYRVKVTGDPALRPQVRRDALQVIAIILDARGIDIPYPHLDLHTK